MDRPVREKLLIAFMTVTLASGILTIAAGSYLLNSMVIREAQRRVSLGLKTARAMLERRGDELMRAAAVTAQWISTLPSVQMESAILAAVRERSGGDFVDVVDKRRVIVAAADSSAIGLRVDKDGVVRTALEEGRASVGVRVVDSRELAAESPRLAAQAYIRVQPTARAKPGGPEEVREALVVEAAYPVMRERGAVRGAVRIGLLLNRNFELVDFIRDNIFTVATYKGKQLGTVTIFLRDVRIATNVIGPNGERAIGTRISAEVYDKVLGRGEVWIGPAFVVDNWYMSAYEPIRDTEGEIIGILYVGVLKDRYDDMRQRALGVFLGIVMISLLVAVGASMFLATRIARPITDLTNAASEIARGNFDVVIASPTQARRDEIKKLRMAFHEMVNALQQRDEEIRRSHEELQSAAEELRRWNQNYLDTLEFITHELKNQIAAMKLNLLAVRDGYVGELSAEQREAIDDVVQAVSRTEDMILNYLNLSRIEKGELEVRARPVQVVTEVVAPVVRDLNGQFDERRMRVEVNIAEDMVVHADPTLLQIVFENLLGNAAKYGREGGLVRVWARRTDGYVEFHVWNEGMGVRREQMEQLFQKFARLEGATATARGTGLGLFVAREIIRKHGGEIWAESEYGKWIDFIFTLPRHDVVLIGAAQQEGERGDRSSAGNHQVASDAEELVTDAEAQGDEGNYPELIG